MYIYQESQRTQKGLKRMRYLFISLFLFSSILGQTVFGCFGCMTVYANPASEQTAETDKKTDEKSSEKPDIKLYATSAVLIDADNNRILYEKKADEIMPMASTTKIMTAILALENGRPDDIVEISAKAASMPKVHLGVKKGEKYYLRDLMYSLMLESHNDSAVAIAEHIGGSIGGFAEMMNKKAEELGCSDTYFVTPNGLDAEAEGRMHATTAYELAKIAAYAIRNEDFVSLINTRSASFYEINSGRKFSVSNKNQFLDMMGGAFGVKTGFTNKAGYCFVGAAKQNGITLISVVLACGWPPHKDYKWSDSKALMHFGFQNYEIKRIDPVPIPDSVPVEQGIEEWVGICIKEPEVSLALSEWDDVRVTREMKECLRAPVQSGEIIGYEKILINGEPYKMLPIKTTAAVGEYTYSYCLNRILQDFAGLMMPPF